MNNPLWLPKTSEVGGAPLGMHEAHTSRRVAGSYRYISRWPALSYWRTWLEVAKAMCVSSGDTCILAIGVEAQWISPAPSIVGATQKSLGSRAATNCALPFR